MQASSLELFFAQLKQQLTNAPHEVRRLFHGRGRKYQGLEQITCDWAQGQLLVNLFKQADGAFLAQLKQGLLELTQQPVWQEVQGSAIVLQHRYDDGAPSEEIGRAHV